MRGGLLAAKDITYVSLANYSQYLVTIITLPLTARILGTEGLGLLAVGMSAYFIGSLIVDLGITSFMAAKVASDDVNQLRGNYLAIRAFILGIIALPLVASLVFGAPIHLHMILLGLFAGGFSSLGEDWVLVGQGRFGALTVYLSLGRIVYLALLTVLLPLLPNSSIAILCLLLSSIIPVVLTWRDTNKSFGRPRHPHAIGRIVKTGAPILTSRLLVTTYGQGAAAVYSGVLDAVTIGLFSAGDRLIRAVQSLLDAVGLGLLPRMARQRDEHDFWRRVAQAAILVICAAIVATILLWISAPLLVHLIFGEEFASAVPILRVESLILPATALSSLVTTAVLTVRQDTLGVLTGAIIGTCVAATSLAVAYGTHSVWALVYGMLLSEYFVAIWYLLRMKILVSRERGAQPSREAHATTAVDTEGIV